MQTYLHLLKNSSQSKVSPESSMDLTISVSQKSSRSIGIISNPKSLELSAIFLTAKENYLQITQSFVILQIFRIKWNRPKRFRSSAVHQRNHWLQNPTQPARWRWRCQIRIFWWRNWCSKTEVSGSMRWMSFIDCHSQGRHIENAHLLCQRD